MNFYKDLLVIDLEMTGLDPMKHEIIQIGAVLLDKISLQEKQSFMTYIRPTKWRNRDNQSMKINNIEKELLNTAPSLKEAILEFNQLFNKPVIICVWGGILDAIFLQKAYTKCHIPYSFDYHVFNIWSLAYPFMAIKNQLKDSTRHAGFSLDGLLKTLKVPIPLHRHDALVDCRLAAEALRQLVNKLR